MIEGVLSAIGAAPDAGLAYGVRDNIITISTRKNLGPDSPVVRTYDVRDLLLGTGAVFELAGLRGPFPPVFAPRQTPESRAAKLIKLVSAALTPRRMNPGTDAFVRVHIWTDRLVLVAPPRQHDQIIDLLRILRGRTSTRPATVERRD